jgi:hypothetical protein
MSRSRVLIGSALLTILCAWPSSQLLAVPPAPVTSPFVYDFDIVGSLDEAPSMGASWSPYFWVSSGGRFYFDGVGATVHGSLAANDVWRLAYASSNPVDTDNGYHPQNIFRMVTRSKWGTFRQQVYFRINADRLSASPNRNASNGVLLLNRYLDQYNLYYTGVRVDGAAVIKKKKGGVYTTLAYAKIFPGTYNRTSNPNLLPKSVWMGITSEVLNQPDGSVRIRFHVNPGNGVWTLVFDTIDDGIGGAPLTQNGYGGLRTDFMDVEFESYLAKKL